MKNKIFALLFCGCLVALFSGCVSTLDGHSQAGWPTSHDRIESFYPRPPAQVFAASKEVIKFMGVLTADNTVSSIAMGKINTSTVWIQVSQKDETVSGVVVQVRTKGGGTDIGLASEVDKRIALQLTQMR